MYAIVVKINENFSPNNIKTFISLRTLKLFKRNSIMLKKIYLIAVFGLITTLAFAQTGTLKGVITDAMSGEPVPFANVIAEKNGNQIGGTTTDFDGNYTIKPLEPGNYIVKATFVG
jgi:hypothetical protein